MTTPEYLTMVRCVTQLTDIIAGDPQRVGESLFSNGYITRSIFEDLQMATIKPRDKASKLVSSVTDRVKVKADTFNDFIRVLKEQGSWTKDLVELLTTTYSDCTDSVAKPKVQQHLEYNHQHSVVEDECNDDDLLHSFLPEHKVLLGENYLVDLCTKLDPLKVAIQLRKQGVFALFDYETVVARTTTQEQNEKILDLLFLKGPKAFEEFIFCLKSINSTHAQLACEIQPVRYRILWFVSSPSHAASVVCVLQMYGPAKFRDITKINSKYLVRYGTIFQRKITPKQDDSTGDDEVLIDNHQDVIYANEVEVCLVFPNSNREDVVKSAMCEAFEKVCPEVDLIVMSGGCVGVRAKKGDVIFVDEGDSVSGNDSDFLKTAKDVIHSLAVKQPKWTKEAFKDGFRTPLFGTIEVPSPILKSQHPKLDCVEDPPTCLGNDTDTCEFYSLCQSRALRSKPRFVCKGVLDNCTTAVAIGGRVHKGTSSTDWSICVLMEVCREFVERFRTSATQL